MNNKNFLKNIEKKDWIIIFTIAIVALISVYRLFSVVMAGLVNNCDHYWIWYDANMAWQHYDLYTNPDGLLLYDGFTVHGEISAVPWGLPMNVLIHGGFLGREAGIIWYSALRLFFFGLMCVAVWKKLGRLNVETWKKILAMLVLVAPWSNISCMTAGNQGQVIVMCIVIAVCFVDENEYIAAALMTLAMIKPQIALPFFVVFLIKKKWKLIFTSAFSVIALWCVSALWTGTTPIAQLEGFLTFTNDLYWDIHVVGICDFLRTMLGVSDNIAMLSSMIVGVATIFVSCILVLKNKAMDSFQLYSIPAIVSIFWCYKSECDYIVVIIAGLGLLTIWNSVNMKMGAQLITALTFFVLFTKPFSQSLIGGWLGLNAYNCYLLDLYIKVLALVVMVYFFKVHSSDIVIKEKR